MLKGNKIIVRNIAFLLLVAITLSFGQSSFAESSNNKISLLSSKNNNRINIENYVSEDYSYFENIYEEEGKIYKVIDNINEDFSVVETKLFEKNNGTFTLIENFKTLIDENKEYINVRVIGSKNNEIFNDNINKISETEDNTYLWSYGPPLCPYDHRYEVLNIKKSNMYFRILSQGAILAIISKVFGWSSTWKGAAGVFFMRLADYVLDHGIRNLYYTKRSYIAIYGGSTGPSDPHMKYWDTFYFDRARTRIQSNIRYTSFDTKGY